MAMAAREEQGTMAKIKELFPNYEIDILQSVFQQTSYDFKETCKVLYEMSQTNQNSTEIVPPRQIENPFHRIIDYIKRGFKIMVLMRGLPGSGKSSLANNLVNDGLGRANLDEFIFSTDHFFWRGGAYIFKPHELDEAHLWNQRRVFSNAKRGVSPIIVDNTNLQEWEMQVYCTMAVDYGYILEIAEPITPWVLNPKILATKNSHGVDKDKILIMKDRYQQNLTIPYLMELFRLHYKTEMPQMRQYPPFIPVVPPKLPEHPVHKAEQPLYEYVHKFQNKREKKTSDKADKLIDIEENFQHTNEDLISFINESKPEPKVQKPPEQSSSTYQITKTLEQNNRLMSQLVTILSHNDAKLTASKIEDKTMDVAGSTSISTTQQLQEENKVLQEMLSSVSKAKGTESDRAPRRNSSKEAQVRDKVLSFLESMEINEPETKKTTVPKYDHKAWGLLEDALAAWDAPVSPLQKATSSEAAPITIELCEQGTTTSIDDYKETRRRIFRKVESGISRKKIMLDKGSMTDEEELLFKLNINEKEQIKGLKELFPTVPLECILDVYEKCQKDFHWTADVISSSPKVLAGNQDAKSPLDSILDLNDWDVLDKAVKSQEEKLKRDEEERAQEKQKREEEEKARLRKEEEMKQERQEKLLELKKQLEKTVTFGKEHYSKQVWEMKNGKVEAPAVPKKLDETNLMEIDDNTIYISDDSDEEDDDDNTEEGTVELDLGGDLVEQLQNMFGRLTIGDKPKSIVQVPESVARQLHGAYLDSLYRQIESQSEHITKQMREDEDFAMKLQEAERQSIYGNSMMEIMDEEMAKDLYKKDVKQWKDLTPDNLALKLTKQKLYAAFPGIKASLLDEIFTAHGKDYKETVETLISSAADSPMAHSENLLEPPISESTLIEMKAQSKNVNEEPSTLEETKTALAYREMANGHMRKRQELLDLAKNQYAKKAYPVAMFYTELAQKELKSAELANQLAAQRFIEENSEKLSDSNTLDLHYLYADTAINSLDIFIDYQISQLKRADKSYDYYCVITGHGKHSRSGKAVLKPVVMKRLKQRNVKYSIVNPGMLKIKLHKNLLMTTDIKKQLSK